MHTYSLWLSWETITIGRGVIQWHKKKRESGVRSLLKERSEEMVTPYRDQIKVTPTINPTPIGLTVMADQGTLFHSKRHVPKSMSV